MNISMKTYTIQRRRMFEIFFVLLSIMLQGSFSVLSTSLQIIEPTPLPTIQPTPLSTFRTDELDAFIALSDALNLMTNEKFRNECRLCEDPRLRTTHPCNCCKEHFKCPKGLFAGINLEGLGLQGTLPSAINSFRALEYLNINENNIHGTIPEVFDIPTMKYILLNANRITGTIPSTIGSMGSLLVLELSMNAMQGTIPDPVWKLPSLQDLRLQENKFSGRLPEAIAGLSALTTLRLDVNEFSGQLPTSLACLTALKLLRLGSNELSGTLPSGLDRLGKLLQLELRSNLLSGTIPPETLRIPCLQLLDLSQNFLSGALPPLLSPNLTYVSVQNNSLSSIPSSFGALSKLVLLNFEYNRIETAFPDICQLTALESIVLKSNKLYSSIPSCLALLPRLKHVKLSNNFFVGRLVIPSQEGIFGKIETFDVSHNLLVGELPSFKKFRNLTIFRINDNKFSGGISSVLPFNAPIKELDISNNRLTGSLPAQLFTLPLRGLIASSNCFSGALPETICSSIQLEDLVLNGLSSACSEFYWGAKGNAAGFTATRLFSKVTGSIPSCIYALPKLHSLQVSGNGLRGLLSDSLSFSSTLKYLGLAHNKLSGTLPSSLLALLPSLQRLNLGYNRIAGTLAGLKMPSDAIDLTINRLSGPIPASALQPQPSSETTKNASLSLKILEGNLFTCDLSRTDLPQTDPYASLFTCGSSTFDWYCWWFFGSFLSLGAALLMLRKIADRYSTMGASLITLVPILSTVSTSGQPIEWKWNFTEIAQWLKQNVLMPPPEQFTTGPQRCTFLSTLYQIRVFAIIVGGVMAIIVLPSYAILTSAYKTHTFEYTWSTTLAFKSGMVPAVILLLILSLVIVAVALLTSIIWRPSEAIPSSKIVSPESASDDNNPLFFPHIFSALRGLSLSTKSKWRLLLLLSFFIADICVYSAANAAFIQTLSTASEAGQVASKIWFAIFKLAANYIVIRGVGRLYGGAHDYRWLAGLFFINNIAIPCLTTATLTPTCFKNSLWAAPAVEALYSALRCTQSYRYDFVGEDKVLVLKMLPTVEKCYGTLISSLYLPSAQYNNQCSSILIIAYAPVFVFINVISLLEHPAQWMMRAICTGLWDVEVMRPLRPYMALTVLKVYRSTSERYVGESLQLDPRVECEPIEPAADQQLGRSKAYHDTLGIHRYHCSVSSDLVVLLTFGLACPLVALTVVASMYTRSVFLQAAAVAALRDPLRLSKAELAFANSAVAEYQPLAATRDLRVLLSAAFIALFIADTGGSGDGALKVVLLVAMTTIPSLAMLAARYIPSHWSERFNVRASAVLSRIFGAGLIASATAPEPLTDPMDDEKGETPNQGVELTSRSADAYTSVAQMSLTIATPQANPLHTVLGHHHHGAGSTHGRDSLRLSAVPATQPSSSSAAAAAAAAAAASTSTSASTQVDVLVKGESSECSLQDE